MDSKKLFTRPLLGFVALIIGALLFAACQNLTGLTRETPNTVSAVTPIPSSIPTVTAAPTVTPLPTETLIPTETLTQTPPPTKTEIIEVNLSILERVLYPCDFKLHPIDNQYPNPQDNLDPLTGTTWMAITVDDGILLEQDSFHYWWDTRAFRGDLSFNVGDGPCAVLLETNQIKCEGIPLRGTENLTTGGYEYDFKLYIQNEDCNSELNYQQRGLIFMDTMEHDVFNVNGEDVP
jgi:hypothetical protein